MFTVWGESRRINVNHKSKQDTAKSGLWIVETHILGNRGLLIGKPIYLDH